MLSCLPCDEPVLPQPADVMNMLQSYQPYHHENWRGLVHRDWAKQLAHCDPLAWMAHHPHELCRQRASRQLYRLKPQGQLMYLKLVIGLNERMALGKANLMDRLKWRLRPSRAIATLKIHLALQEHGLDCPLPILAAREHAGDQSREVLVCDAVDQPGLGDHLATLDDPQQVTAILNRTAAHIARFHQARFIHGDLLPNNLHVNADISRIWFMDNDRTIRWPWPPPWRMVQRNLAQLTYRLLYHQKEQAARAFLQAYGQAAQWSGQRIRKRTDLLIAQAQKRAKRDKPQSRKPQPNKPSSL